MCILYTLNLCLSLVSVYIVCINIMTETPTFVNYLCTIKFTNSEFKGSERSKRMTNEQREAAINLLSIILSGNEEKEDIDNEIRQDKNKIVPEMISLREARERTGLSRQALYTIFAACPESYIKNGRCYIVNWTNLCRALDMGQRMLDGVS